MDQAWKPKGMEDPQGVWWGGGGWTGGKEEMDTLIADNSVPSGCEGEGK